MKCLRFSFDQGKLEPVNCKSLAHELLETNKCYFLDYGAELYVWMGRITSLQERKGASEAAEVTFVHLLSYAISSSLSATLLKMLTSLTDTC
jgi:hypothetical protein